MNRRRLIVFGIILILLSLLLRTIRISQEVKNEEANTNIEEAEPQADPEEHGAEQDAEDRSPSTDIPQSTGEEIMTALEEYELEQIGIAEAEGEGIDGIWLVMCTVMNRVADPAWPDTVSGVIHQYSVNKKGKKVYQFSSVSNGRFDRVKPNNDSHEALAMIKAGEIKTGIVGFEVSTSNVLEKWFKYAFTFRNHKFYTKK